MLKKILVIFCVLIYYSATAKPIIQIDPIDIDFGIFASGKPVFGKFTVMNTGTDLLTVKAKPTCTICTIIKEDDFSIKPNQFKTIDFQLIVPEEFSGMVTKNIIIESNDPDNPRLFFVFTGEAINYDQNKINEIEAKINYLTKLDLNKIETADNLIIFSDKNNSKETDVINSLIYWIYTQHPETAINFYNLATAENKKNFMYIQKQLNILPEFPFIIYNGLYYLGKDQIYNLINNIHLTKDNIPPQQNILSINNPSHILSSIIGGLKQGINQCTLFVIILFIIFLLSSFPYSNLLSTALPYIILFFSVQLMINSGFISIIPNTNFFIYLSIIIKLLFSIGVFVLAIISIIDYKKGLLNKAILLLPGMIPKSNNRKNHQGLKKIQWILISVALGSSASMTSFTCNKNNLILTLQGMIHKKDQLIPGLLLIIIYNLAIILPLIIIFIIILIGFNKNEITIKTNENYKTIKMFYFIFYIILGLSIVYLTLSEAII